MSLHLRDRVFNLSYSRAVSLRTNSIFWVFVMDIRAGSLEKLIGALSRVYTATTLLHLSLFN